MYISSQKVGLRANVLMQVTSDEQSIVDNSFTFKANKEVISRILVPYAVSPWNNLAPNHGAGKATIKNLQWEKSKNYQEILRHA